MEKIWNGIIFTYQLLSPLTFRFEAISLAHTSKIWAADTFHLCMYFTLFPTVGFYGADFEKLCNWLHVAAQFRVERHELMYSAHIFPTSRSSMMPTNEITC